MSNYIYFSDGSNSHPKGLAPAGAAFVVFLGGTPVHHQMFPMESGTNNDSEMRGIMEGINHFALTAQDGDTAVFKSDSQFCVRLIAGYLDLRYHPVRYGIGEKSEKFRPMLSAIKRVWDDDYMQLHWISREGNRRADKLATQARLKALEIYK